jgi:hypothetical protein
MVSGHLGFGIFRRDLLVLNFCSQRNCWTDSSSESAACGFAAISFAGFIGTFPYFGVVVTNFSGCIATSGQGALLTPDGARRIAVNIAKLPASG